MAASVMSSVSLKPSPFTVEKSTLKGLPSLARTASFRVQASGGKKIKTDKPFGMFIEPLDLAKNCLCSTSEFT